jgi:UTP--glucose-1-phosphate uridylyltransferase
LNKIKAGSGGEVQLTDAIAREIAQGGNVYAYRFQGQRYDCGSKIGFLQATVAFGLARDDLKDEFSHYLSGLTLPNHALPKSAQSKDTAP